MYFVLRGYFLSAFLLLFFIAFAQKKELDSIAYGKWPNIGSLAISNNGRFISFQVSEINGNEDTCFIYSSDGGWCLKIANASRPIFSGDSKFAIVSRKKGRVDIVELGTAKIQHLVGVGSMKVSDDGRWLAYMREFGKNEVIIKEIVGHQLSDSLNGVDEFRFAPSGNGLLFRKVVDSVSTLFWLNLHKKYQIIDTLWYGPNVSDIVFNRDGSEMVFFSQDGHNDSCSHSIWHCFLESGRSVQVASDKWSKLGRGVGLGSVMSFNSKGDGLLISLISRNNNLPDLSSPGINIWSYADRITQYHQIQMAKDNPKPSFEAILSFGDSCIRQLIFPGESAFTDLFGRAKNGFNDSVCIMSVRNSEGQNWSNYIDSVFLLSTRSGSRRYIAASDGVSSSSCSPGGHYLVYYSISDSCYYSYNIWEGKSVNITPDYHAWICDKNVIERGVIQPPLGWMKGDSGVILLDDYDIWKIDPQGIRPAVNLTNGYGRKHHIIFRFIKDIESAQVSNDKTMILSAFNVDSKENGFYKIKLNHSQDPILLTMGPYTYYAPQKVQGLDYSIGSKPIKAKDNECYLLRRMNSTEYNNIFFTKNFRQFRRFSNLEPEHEYNWMTSELIHWKNADSTESNGILYKPENFDPKMSYPVIFYYYVWHSDDLYTFLTPNLEGGALDVAWYVSHGYLVVEPNVRRTSTFLKTALYTVVGAAKYMSRFSFVDSSRMAIDGFSLGGVETNYIVTNTHMFAAASSEASISDYISAYGELSHGGYPFEGVVGAPIGSLWDNDNWYEVNSPVLNAYRVTTPLLLFETTHDDACPFSQGLEFFLDLRRLGKVVWMLEYEDGDHGVYGKWAYDISIRRAQFFEYYLRRNAAPVWMVEGIPASKKGIEDGLKLEPTGVRLPNNILKAKEKSRLDSLMWEKDPSAVGYY